MATSHYTFKPLNVGRWLTWGLFALLLIVAPQIFTSGLGMTVLAEGVETQGQLEFLRSHGSNAFQGYLCSKPRLSADFVALLQT